MSGGAALMDISHSVRRCTRDSPLQVLVDHLTFLLWTTMCMTKFTPEKVLTESTHDGCRDFLPTLSG